MNGALRPQAPNAPISGWAVQAAPNETVVLSWIEYPSKAVRDEVMAKMMGDPRMKALGENMPFDAKRMIFGSFAPIFDERS